MRNNVRGHGTKNQSLRSITHENELVVVLWKTCLSHYLNLNQMLNDCCDPKMKEKVEACVKVRAPVLRQRREM